MNKLQSRKQLEQVIRKYRKRVGLDPIDVISISIVEDHKLPKSFKKSGGADAWVESDEDHPIHYIYIRKGYLHANKRYPRHILRTLVHELLHIVIGTAFIHLKRSYDGTNAKDLLVEETLVAKMAKAIVPVKDNELYDHL